LVAVFLVQNICERNVLATGTSDDHRETFHYDLHLHVTLIHHLHNEPACQALLCNTVIAVIFYYYIVNFLGYLQRGSSARKMNFSLLFFFSFFCHFRFCLF